jgi:hypothetical protein
LPCVVQEQCGENQARPGEPDRQPAEMTEVGIEQQI